MLAVDVLSKGLRVIIGFPSFLGTFVLPSDGKEIPPGFRRPSG
jgi:hypothetical protein